MQRASCRTGVKQAAAGENIHWTIFKGEIEIAEDFDSPLDEFKDYV